uniref:Ubiquitin-like domain-containing protein n=1 Tax=Ascaris lumbricoides TaxID=6252 RepID=A0A0M3HN59_ASCLU
MSSGDELRSSEQSGSTIGENHIAVRISTMTGHEWIELISPTETVQSLKEKIWERCGLLPYHQGLIFCGESLSDHCGQIPLRNYGVQQNSTIRLVIVTRSGPLAVSLPSKQTVPIAVHDGVPIAGYDEECWHGERIFGERFLEENRRTLFKMCELRRQMRQNAIQTKPLNEHYERRIVSAPEDTSAKESSAGDTECDEESSSVYPVASVKLPEVASASNTKIIGKRIRQNLVKGEEGCSGVRDVVPSARERLLLLMHSRGSSPATDVNTHSEDGSEFSSGMIICDLSNEFRRLRVRRRHHGPGGASAAVQKARARSKPRTALVAFTHQHKGSDATSSDEERPCMRRAPDATLPSCSSLRRPWAPARAQKTFTGCQSQQRCYACAAKLNSFSLAFQCRCGKTLCARHRAPDMHTCTRLRKLQDVSD